LSHNINDICFRGYLTRFKNHQGYVTEIAGLVSSINPKNNYKGKSGKASMEWNEEAGLRAVNIV